jgi:hypothetical protein
MVIDASLSLLDGRTGAIAACPGFLQGTTSGPPIE